MFRRGADDCCIYKQMKLDVTHYPLHEPLISQAENEDEKRRATLAQAEAESWKSRFEAERALRRVLNAKVLDMQVRPT